MQKIEGELLGITKAANLLGVHPLTLRSWAEKGYISYYRTPGGHRRFKRNELARFLSDMNQVEDGDELLITAARKAVHQAIQTLPQHHPTVVLPAARQISSKEQRLSMRSVGRKLLGLTIQYIAAGADETVLEQGRTIGRTYGEFAGQNEMSVSETVATFNFFRDTIIESTFDSQSVGVGIDTSSPQLYRRLNLFFNEILLATVQAVEDVEDAVD